MPSTPIANCPVEFRFQCPKLWENLDTTADPDIRFCQTCRKDIFLCRTMEQVARHALAGDCIAVSAPDSERIDRIGEAVPDWSSFHPPEANP